MPTLYADHLSGLLKSRVGLRVGEVRKFEEAVGKPKEVAVRVREDTAY
jgi:hypothetical protein